MAKGAGKIGIKVMTMVIGIPISMATKRVVQQAWLAAHPEDPPRKPGDEGVRWGDAVAWAALSAAGIVAADLLSRRGAEGLWRFLIGTEPPAAATTRGGKQLEQAERTLEVARPAHG